MGMRWNNTHGLSVFLLGPCYQKAWLTGMRRWKRRACCCMSWWRALWWSCVRRFVAASLRVGRACVARELSVGWFDHTRNLDTSLVVFLRGICSGLGPSEGGIVYGLFSKEALHIGKASVNRTHCPGLASRLTEHFRCLYRPGLEDASKPRYRLLRRRLWSVRFFPLAVFPTISRTSDGQCEGCGGGASTVKQGRRMPRSGRLVDGRRAGDGEKRQPWESIWGCSAVKEALSYQFRGKPVQFRGAVGKRYRRRARTTTTQQPHDNHTTTTQQPHNNHTITTQQPHNNHTTTTQQPHNNHTTTTQQPHNNHSTTTQQPHNNHTTTTQQPRNNHATTTQQPRNNHATTTQQPRNNHATTTQQPRNNHATTTQQPHNNHTTTTQQPHNNHTTTTQQPHNNHTTTTQQPHNNHTTTTQQPHNNHTTTTQQPHNNHTTT